MDNLVIFTNNFPFGDGETFLETELEYLSLSFKKIHFFPLFYGKNRSVRSLPKNVTYSNPFLKIDSLNNKGELLFYGLFNTSPLSFFFGDFFKKKIFYNLSHLKNWVADTCINRVILKKKNRELILSKINSSSVLYFYWGDKSTGIVPYFAEKISNPIIARFHNSDLYEEIKNGYIPFRQDLLKTLTTSVFISKKGEEYLINKYSNIKFKHKLFRLGVNDSGLTKLSQDNVLRIVSCSYVVPIKRLNLILEALNKLDFKIEWTHLGGGILLDNLKKQSEKLRPNVKSNFYGQISNEDVVKYYLNNPVDLFINVSESEGIPVSIMEAISTGIPIIATDVGGTSEIVDDKFGKLIYKDFAIEELSAEIENYHEKNLPRKEEMSKNARNFWFERYNAEINYKKFSEFLVNL